MSNLFKAQSLITLSLETGQDLSAATVKKILYIKPNGYRGYWVATVSGTKLTYSVLNSDIDKSGLWRFQAYAEIGGKKAFGDIVEQFFEEPILTS